MIVPPKFDWTISPTTILSAVWLVVIYPIYKSVSAVAQIMLWMKEYPPHIHEFKRIRYPKGMKPDRPDRLDADEVED